MEKTIELLKDLVYKGAEDKKVVLTRFVLDRIKRELSVIEKNGFANHFILYSRIAEVCNELRLICSPGRGHSINSMVNYCLDITKVNPINENLWFECFLHRGQINLPDIDIDVPYGSQQIVIERLKSKHPDYFIYPISFNRIDKKISIHPCGVIITHAKLENSTFLYQEQEFYQSPDVHNDPIYSNFKVDILELFYLKRLQFIVDEIGEEYHPYKLPLNDKQVFDFFASGDLENLFQLDSPKLGQLFAKARPSSINDLSSAYYRLKERPATSNYFSNILSYTILSYWGCYYKTHFRKEFEMAFGRELNEY